MRETTADSRATLLRFTLRGLLLLVVFAALGSLLVRDDLERWHRGLIVVATGWLLSGIGNQVVDLLRAVCRRENASWTARGTIAVELVRRVVLAVVLGAYLAWLVLHSPQILTDDLRRRLSWVEWGMPDCLFLLAVMAVLLLAAPQRDILRRRFARGVRNCLLGICGAVWLYYVYRERLMVHALVQRAISGVIAGLRYTDLLGPSMSGAEHDEWVFACGWSAFIATVTLVLAVVFARLLIRRWDGSWSRGIAWTVPLALSLGICGWEIYWASSIGFPSVEYYYGTAQELPAGINLLQGGAILLIFATEATLRLGQVHEPQGCVLWRLRPDSYFHERPMMVIFLLVTLLSWLVNELFWEGLDRGLVEIRPTIWRTFAVSSSLMIMDSSFLLKIACVLLSGHVLYCRATKGAPPLESAPLRLMKFGLVWSSALVLTGLSVATPLWLYYTACLMPR